MAIFSILSIVCWAASALLPPPPALLLVLALAPGLPVPLKPESLRMPRATSGGRRDPGILDATVRKARMVIVFVVVAVFLGRGAL